jgi:hypothetical protein
MLFIPLNVRPPPPTTAVHEALVGIFLLHDLERQKQPTAKNVPDALFRGIFKEGC